VNDLEKLLAIEQIKQLKARYFRCVDTKDWTGFKGVFAPDVIFDVSQDVAGCILTSPDSIVQFASVPLTGCVSVHHGHCPEIEITSRTTATGIWAMEDMLRWADDSPSPIKALHGYGHYIETYERLEGIWYIKTWKLTRLRVDIEQRKGYCQSGES
jgi:hypothetical protein